MPCPAVMVGLAPAGRATLVHVWTHQHVDQYASGFAWYKVMEEWVPLTNCIL